MGKPSAGELQAAVDQVKNWARRNEAINVVAALLERLGSLEQAEAELAGSVDQLGKKRGEVETAVQAAKDALVEQEKKNSEIATQAEAYAGQVRTEADKVAAEVRGAADAYSVDVRNAADVYVIEARKQGDAELASVREEKAEEDKELAVVGARVAAANEELNGINRKLDAARAAYKAALA